MSPKPLHCLVVELPGHPARHYLLASAGIRLGRVEGNAIVVAEDAVSATHCELRRTPSGGYALADLGSTNGTRLNGERVGADPVELRDGDVLVLGIAAMARFVRLQEIRDHAEPRPVDGAATRRLETPEMPPRPAINPVAAAVAKAARAKAKTG
jgi:pSer/pThr/pTyr-binding forkhead associated (FHA) protein